MIIIRIFCSVVIFVLFDSSYSFAQIISTPMEKGKFQLGISQKHFHRDIRYYDLYNVKMSWATCNFFVRYGLSKRITLSAEGMVSNFKDDNFPERDYKDYLMGLGISTHLFRIKNINISFSANVSRILSHDRSVYQHDKIQDDYSFMIQTERTFIIKNQKIKPFFGPVYVKNILYDYNDFYTEVKGKSVRNFGFAAGVNIILFNHIDCFSHIVYVNYFQPRFGIGYIF